MTIFRRLANIRQLCEGYKSENVMSLRSHERDIEYTDAIGDSSDDDTLVRYCKPECLHSIKFTVRSVIFINLSVTTGVTLFKIYDLPGDFLQ